MKNRKVVIALTGGLGNQLFQLAAGLSRSDSVEIDCSLLSPRLSSLGLPEIESFTLPTNVSFKNLQKGKPFFLSKVTGYLLRSAINRRRVEKIWGYMPIMRQVGRIILSARAKKNFNLLINRGVGFSEISSKPGSNLLIGYFQSYKWSSENRVLSQMKKITPKQHSRRYEELKMLATSERPLVVHMRLGDYLNESEFGVPSLDYYLESISSLWDSGIYKKIWLFSDDIPLAKEKIGNVENGDFRWIDGANMGSAETLELMRHGYGYVIANSTFSWWGAFLSHTNNPVVIAPSPWFAGMSSPVDLIPPSWQTRKAF